MEKGGKHVAVKIFNAASAETVMRSEVQVLKAAQGHRNIVRLVEDFDAYVGPRAFVLELCQEDLHTLTSANPFMEDEAVKIMRGVLSALDHLRELCIVHRDVKPENIALGEDGSPRLIDFGVAAFLSDEKQMSMFRGTPGYAAPEIVKKQANGFPADMFAAGATWFYILSGQLAFATETMSKRSILVKTKKCVVSFDCKFDNVTDATKDMIRWLMHKHASWRPQPRAAVCSSPFVVASSNARRPPAAQTFAFQEAPLSLDVRPPSGARSGRARPAPKARIRQGPEVSSSSASTSG
eukprot:TRINITY_DN8456_c0_g4_i1.p1 TRINITY_DN8456_c0_g4~~TRINITY_DN8456_c0_g4_i1.p1  ORF type:complete len:340 (+),score=45.65 TRINITY_DN8456_c0_g4_i1:136-1020(+)